MFLRTGAHEVTESIPVNQAEICDLLTFRKKPSSHPSQLPRLETQQPGGLSPSPGGKTQVKALDAPLVGDR